jgi:hypothetical protein
MPCTLHIHGESVAVTDDPSVIMAAIVNGTKYLTVTRQSDLLKVQLIPGQVGYVVPQPGASTGTP